MSVTQHNTAGDVSAFMDLTAGEARGVKVNRFGTASGELLGVDLTFRDRDARTPNDKAHVVEFCVSLSADQARDLHKRLAAALG